MTKKLLQQLFLNVLDRRNIDISLNVYSNRCSSTSRTTLDFIAIPLRPPEVGQNAQVQYLELLVVPFRQKHLVLTEGHHLGTTWASLGHFDPLPVV